MSINWECDIVRLVAVLLLYRDVTIIVTSCDTECTLFECILRIYQNCCSPFGLENDVATDDEPKDKWHENYVTLGENGDGGDLEGDRDDLFHSNKLSCMETLAGGRP
jgi:hypothetical protein